MPIYRRASSSWTTIRNVYRRTSGSWVKINAVYRRAGGVWNRVFSSNNSPTIQTRVGLSSDISLVTDSNFATLTGTNYYWTPISGLTLTYSFEKSTSITFTSPTLISSGAITNPSSGSSNTVTQTIYAGAFSQTDMYFRFKVSATNSFGTTISVSDIISISYIGTPVPNSPYPSITGSTTVGNTAYGNIGTWTNSPTSYDYRWFFMSGATSYPLTFSQSRTVSNKYLSGFSAALVTSASHGYKANDQVVISGMDSLFNGTYTITAKTNSTIYFTINTPTAWANAGTAYSSGTFVSLSGNAYSASGTISSASLYSSSTTYSSGAIVYSGNNRYQSNLNSNLNKPLTDVIWWNNLGSYAPGGSQWTLQSFSNTVASGTTTSANYYEGTTASSTSYALTVPATDYRSGLDMIGKALYFGVKAYNSATPSPSEYSNYKLVYGVPVITIGTIVPGSTSASIPYTQSYMTSYDIDIKYLGSSVSGYPATVSSPSSPISVTGLLAPRTYAYTITPKNGEGTSGTAATGTFATVPAPTISGISVTDTTLSPSSATSISTSSASNVGTTSWTNGANTSFANLSLVSGSGTLAQQADPTSLATSGTFAITSTGNANITIRAINNVKTATVTWAQTNAQSYTINYSIGGLGVQTPISANSSASNPSVLLYSNTVARSVTINSITVYPQQNQQGTGVTLSSTSTVTPANKTTNTSATNAVTYALLAGYTPTFSATYTINSDGWTGNISNYSASYTWNISTSAGSVAWNGSPNIATGNYQFTVTGLNPGQQAIVTVTTVRSGYNNGSATQTLSAALGAALTPTFGTNTRTSGGFSGSVTNYSSSYTWNISVSGGAAVSWGTVNGSTYPFTVTGGTAGTSYTVTVTTPRTGYSTGSGTTSASALSNLTTNPAYGTATSGSLQFTASITTSPNPTGGTYSVVTQTNGTASVNSSTGALTVTGLTKGQSSTATVRYSLAGYNSVDITSTGSASSNEAPSGGSVSIALTTGTDGRVGAIYTATVTNASGTPTPTFTRQWKRSNNYSPFTTSNVGTDSATYTSTFDDVDSAIYCIVTFTNAAGTQTATSNSLQVSPPTITAIRATTTNNTAPYCTWEIIGYNIQSSSGSVYYGTSTAPATLSGTNPQANAGLTRATNSRTGTGANYYKYDNVRAFSGASGTGRPSPSAAAIATTTVVRANAATTTTVYGTYP